MRALLFSLLVGILSLLHSESSTAQSADNHTVVGQYYFDAMGIQKSPQSLGLGYVRALEHSLEARSVLVLDKKKFAKLLPSALISDMYLIYQSTLFDACVARLSDAQAATLARFILSRTESSPINSKDMVEQDLRMCLRDIRWFWPKEDAFTKILSIRHHDPEVAAILAMPGIARFPNRIVKQDVLLGFQ
ncbi:hypothetical protein [uncultured Tateyamaria sp.]|uniref:hypothetical protein n=1 Tax=uncultured Tateyamaria sp. TaxID=455651 RepID=UPI002613A55A|nr:hypothetical protein [uncultured Tateyamaria sp.]